MFKVHISSFQFFDGTEISLSKNSALVIIGPNNSGKSATLKSIIELIRDNKGRPPVSKVNLELETPLEEVEEFMKQHQTSPGRFDVPGFSFGQQNIQQWWREGGAIGNFFTNVVVSNLSTQSRLNDCTPPKTFEARQSFSASHPFQYMFRDNRLEKDASEVIKKAFKADLVIHRFNSASIPAYIGSRLAFSEGEKEGDKSYSLKIEALDKLEEQGDGVQSFVSIIGRVLTESRPIQLIDEPEAFLHPPQARLIGEEIVKNSKDRQSIIATHSSDVLRGILSQGEGVVSVVRLRRNQEKAVSYLKNEDIARLWKDAVLRFSNLFDGLFHDAVIITEGDADCRFYEALINSVSSPDERPDLHYAYSGGKERIPVLVEALSALEVPVVAILDFDVLNNEHPLREIFEANGGNWNNIKEDWLKVKNSVEETRSFVGGDDFRVKIQEFLGEYGANTVVPKEILKKIRDLTRSASPWDSAKKAGQSIITSGEPTQAFVRLIRALSANGIFVVQAGEMEGFCRSIGGHGRRWVQEVMKKDIATEAELNDARNFAASIVSWLRRT